MKKFVKNIDLMFGTITLLFVFVCLYGAHSSDGAPIDYFSMIMLTIIGLGEFINGIK